MIPRRALLRAAALALPLAACTAPPPPRDAIARAAAGTETLVLLRLVGTDQNGISRQPLLMDLNTDPIGTGWGDFDSGGAPGPWIYHTPSPEAWRDGWIVMLLPPGQYYLFIQPPRRTDVLTYARRLPAAPRWRIEIPRGGGLLYAGTLALGEITEPGLFSRLWTGIDPQRTTVLDETPTATAIAARDLPALPPPRTRLMQPHTGPVRLGPPP